MDWTQFGTFLISNINASNETELDIKIFPEECPWTIDELLSEEN